MIVSTSGSTAPFFKTGKHLEVSISAVFQAAVLETNDEFFYENRN